MSGISRVALALVGAVVFPVLAMAEAPKSTEIVTSFTRSATISAIGMPPGSEMWASWLSLPAGSKVELQEPKVKGTWMGLEVGLTGSAVSAPLSAQVPEAGCVLFDDEGQRSLTAQEVTTGRGDAFACNFTTGIPYWEENRGGELYSRVQLNVGGPWVPGMFDIAGAHRTAGGDVQALRVDKVLFGKVAEELRAAGMMIATARIVTMPPGSRSVAADRYPTLRMVTSGELMWAAMPVEAQASAMPKGLFKLSRFNWIEWTKPQQVVLSNETENPAELVEWSITPAGAAAP